MHSQPFYYGLVILYIHVVDHLMLKFLKNIPNFYDSNEVILRSFRPQAFSQIRDKPEMLSAEL